MRQAEKDIIVYLLKKGGLNCIDEDYLSDVMVEEMDDGGMGSIKLLPKNARSENRKFGCKVSDEAAVDSDGVSIVLSLDLDEDGCLFELDVWKTDFSPVIKLPVLKM